MRRDARVHVRGAARAFVAPLVAALAVLAVPSSASGWCNHCLSNNDTTFTPGKVGIYRRFLGRAITPPIAYVGVDGRLRCAIPDPPGWVSQVVDPSATAGGCSLALDAALEPQIAYHDANGMLFWAHRIGTAWIQEPVDPASAVLGGTAIDLAPGGVGIAYVDATTGLLKYAERLTGGGWAIDLVAPVGTVEAYPSLASDGATRAISYYDASAGDLRWATYQAGATWSTAAVDTVGNVGGFSSLVGGSAAGGFGIAYYDFGNSDLRYAHSTAAGWQVETVDGAGVSVGPFCSAVAFTADPQDHVAIGYYDRTNGDLKLALKRGTWSISVLDTSGDAGGWVSCGASPSPADTFGVAYVRRATGDLEYLWWAGGVAAVPVVPKQPSPLAVQWERSGGGGRVRFRVAASGTVRVSLFDAQGRPIAIAWRGALPAGPAEVRWDGHDRSGAWAPAGVLFVRVETASGAGVARAVLLR